MGADTDWDMVGAIGQWAGAAATFAAVAFSLWQVKSERRVSIQLTPSRSFIFDRMGSQPVSVLAFSITNTGFRSVKVQSVGWESGWLRIGRPKWLEKRASIQMLDSPLSSHLPVVLQPGDSVTLMADGQNVFGKKSYEDMFMRDIPLLGKRRARVKAVAHTTLGSVKVNVPNGLVDLLRGAISLDTRPEN
jgi:hypothetical protein